MTIIGTSNYSYRLIENWTQLPLGEMFGNVSAATTDQVCVIQRKDPPVVVFDWDGIFYLSEGGVNGLAPRISLVAKHGTVVARWDSLSTHGSGWTPTVTSTWRWARQHGWTSRRGRASQRGTEAQGGTCGAPLSRSPMDRFFADRAGFRVVRGDAAVRQAWGLEVLH